jgi:hypothetical protein
VLFEWLILQYCFYTNNGYGDTEGVLFSLVGATSSIIMWFGYKTFKLVRDNSIGRKRSPHASNIEATSPPQQILSINSPHSPPTGTGTGTGTAGGIHSKTSP